MSLGYIGENIPKEWSQPLLTDLVSPKQWKTISAKELLEEGYIVYGANGKIGFYTEFTHEKPTLMITCRGATCGNLHISEPYSYINGNAMALDEQPVNLIGVHFLRHALEARGLIDTISGSAQPQITRQGLSEVRIPLPPLAEQKVIADKLDILLAQVKNTKARLERIPTILKTFRQSVLAAAVSGELTNISSINFVNIREIAQVIGGLTKNSKRNDFELKVPYLRVANVYENELKLNDISEIGVQKNELSRVSLEYEDLLIVEGNGSLDQIGRAALWRDEIKGCVHQNHLIKVRADKNKISPKFILFYLMSAQGKVEIINRATSGAGLYTLSISKISSINVPLYSLSEQTEIVRRVEQLFVFADHIEQKANAALAHVNNLTQSILAKAFRGELTAEWRAANPELISGENSAEALLAKIKAEREALKTAKQTRGRKKA